ncbi:MAG: hypothetical protein AAF199_05030, partial [Pseudomonadota bacterium]
RGCNLGEDLSPAFHAGDRPHPVFFSHVALIKPIEATSGGALDSTPWRDIIIKWALKRLDGV